MNPDENRLYENKPGNFTSLQGNRVKREKSGFLFIVLLPSGWYLSSYDYFMSKLHWLTDIPVEYTRIPSEPISAEQQHLVKLDVATTNAIRLIKGKGNDRGTLASKDSEVAKFFQSQKTYKIN